MTTARNYNEWLYSMIKPYLGNQIMEVGAGIGTISEKILEDNLPLTAIEPNKNCQRFLKQKFANDPNFKLLPSTIEELAPDKGQKGKFNTIICLNVLEHIQQDQNVIKLLFDFLEENGYLILIVPAVPWAFGSIDKSVGHYRRYSKKGLRSLFSSTDFIIEKMHYYNLPGLFGWYFNSRILRIQSQNQGQVCAFDKLVPCHRKVETIVHPPIGMSLFAAVKRASK